MSQHLLSPMGYSIRKLDEKQRQGLIPGALKWDVGTPSASLCQTTHPDKHKPPSLRTIALPGLSVIEPMTVGSVQSWGVSFYRKHSQWSAEQVAFKHQQ